MKTYFPSHTEVAIFALALTGIANATNIDIQADRSPVAMTGLAVAVDAEGVAVQLNMVEHNVSNRELNLSDGTASGVTITLTGATNDWAHVDSPESSNIRDNALLFDYAYANASNSHGAIDFTLGNVQAGAYDLYVYGGLYYNTLLGDLLNTVSVDGEVSQYITWTAPDPGDPSDAGTFQKDENYVIFKGVFFEAVGSITGSISSLGEANLSGF